jgi:hypothetical protein
MTAALNDATLTRALRPVVASSSSSLSGSPQSRPRRPAAPDETQEVLPFESTVIVTCCTVTICVTSHPGQDSRSKRKKVASWTWVPAIPPASGTSSVRACDRRSSVDTDSANRATPSFLAHHFSNVRRKPFLESGSGRPPRRARAGTFRPPARCRRGANLSAAAISSGSTPHGGEPTAHGSARPGPRSSPSAAQVSRNHALSLTSLALPQSDRPTPSAVRRSRALHRRPEAARRLPTSPVSSGRDAADLIIVRANRSAGVR